MTGPRTVWRLVALVEGAGVIRSGLDVELSVATTADVVVEAIERAARANGIRLERVATIEPAPERSTSPARAAGSSSKSYRRRSGPNVVQDDGAESR
jgi:hypothetical protein